MMIFHIIISVLYLCTYQCLAQVGWGGGGGQGGGVLTFFFQKEVNSPPPGQNNWSKCQPRSKGRWSDVLKPCCRGSYILLLLIFSGLNFSDFLKIAKLKTRFYCIFYVNYLFLAKMAKIKSPQNMPIPFSRN